MVAKLAPCCTSDLDLLVEFDSRPLTLLQFIALEYELSDQLQIRVDLVEKSALHQGGQKAIEWKKILLPA
jgi:predicted nucleotidyltransferase